MTRRELLESFTAGLAALSVPGLIWQERRTQGRSVPVEPDPPVTERELPIDLAKPRLDTIHDLRQRHRESMEEWYTHMHDQAVLMSLDADSGHDIRVSRKWLS